MTARKELVASAHVVRLTEADCGHAQLELSNGKRLHLADRFEEVGEVGLERLLTGPVSEVDVIPRCKPKAKPDIRVPLPMPPRPAVLCTSCREPLSACTCTNFPRWLPVWFLFLMGAALVAALLW